MTQTKRLKSREAQFSVEEEMMGVEQIEKHLFVYKYLVIMEERMTKACDDISRTLVKKDTIPNLQVEIHSIIKKQHLVAVAIASRKEVKEEWFASYLERAFRL